MANYIKEHVSGKFAVLTDNSQTFAVMLLTGQLPKFFDRVSLGDGPWKHAAKFPPKDVKYFLFAQHASNDELLQIYPQLATAQGIPQLPVVLATPRYTLVRVPPHFSIVTEMKDRAEAASNTTTIP
jgi:hypothetical protein